MSLADTAEQRVKDEVKPEPHTTVEAEGLFGTPWVPVPVTQQQALAADLLERAANVVNATSNLVTFNP